MLRNRAVALILCWLASPLAYCLGLGPLEASSGLNEPFKGRIQILGAKAEDFDTLTVGLAGDEQFERAGIERHPALFQLRFTLDDSSPGKDFIAITSRDPVREPFLNFLLEMNWPNGRLLREYTVLLDPPLYDPQRRAQAPAAAPAVTRAPATAPRPTSNPAGWAARATTAPASSFAAGQEIGPVQASDTLWSLAMAYRPDSSVSVQQMMLALLRANPDAFSQGNINMLRRGAVLRLPDAAALNAVEASEAYAEVRRQHQVWEEYRQQIGSAPAPQPIGAAAAPEASSGPATTPAADAAADARLELVAPGGTEGGGTPGGAAATGGGTGELASEAVDSKTQEAADLQDKLKEAEEIIDLLQRQVNIKDEELAALQARLAELGVDTGTAATEAPADGAAVPADAAAGTGETPDTASATDETVETPAADAEIAADEAIADDTVVDEAIDEDAVIDETASPAEVEPPTDEQAVEAAAPVPAPEPAEPGFPANLVPPGIAALVPGGPLTILGVAALIVLGLFAAVAQFLIKSRDRDATPLAEVRAKAPATEAVTLTAATAAAPDDSEAVTQFGLDTVTEAPAFDPLATIEATAGPSTEAGDLADHGDPLEEVNVYLAYERFDQAEELVKRVIAQYPNRHDYKLRLLEVYYSSNDRQAYEATARELFDAVGESDPLWGSAVAMWAEMSPERALFAEGAVIDASPAPDSAKAFVDITGDTDDEPGESTLAHAPGGHDSELDGGLDFNLGDATEGGDDILDLTATADGSDIFDLTAASTETTDSDVFDITVGDGDSGILDISGGGDATDGAVLDVTDGDSGMLDLTGSDDILDITGLENEVASGSDLLDVTKTGDISSVEDHDLLNVTSPGMRTTDPLAASVDDADTSDLAAVAVAELGADTTGSGLDFDISDTVAPAFSAHDDADDEILDITSGAKTTDDDVLDFDIGGLDLGGAGAQAAADPDQVATVELAAPAISGTPSGGLDLDLDMGDEDGAGGDLDFDITMGAEDLDIGLGLGDTEQEDGEIEISLGPVSEAPVGELSLQGSALDDLALDGSIDGTADEFDFALDGTTEMDGIAADETLDMASVVASNREILDAGDDASLEDLTVELDNALGMSGLDTVELDLGDDDLLTTMSLDIDGDETLVGAGDTVIMPRIGGNDPSDDNDEADTKLNLAKAYIELGDSDGARSILDEVIVDGNDQQKAEARMLLGQLGS